MVDHEIDSLFNSIYDSTHKKVLGYITSKCGRIDDIRDIFQDTYMELYAVMARRGADYIKNKDAFVVRLAKNKIFRYYLLQNRSKTEYRTSIFENENGDELEIDIAEIALSTEEIVCEKETINEVIDLLRSKPDIVRKIFYLFYYLDLTIPQIAKQLSLSESDVKNKLYRTIKEIRNLYQQKGGVCNERKGLSTSGNRG